MDRDLELQEAYFNSSFSQTDDLMLGMLVLLIDYPSQDIASLVRGYEEDGKPIFDSDELMEFARNKGRQFKEYVNNMNRAKTEEND